MDKNPKINKIKTEKRIKLYLFFITNQNKVLIKKTTFNIYFMIINIYLIVINNPYY